MKRKLAFAITCYLMGGALFLAWEMPLWVLFFQAVLTAGLIFVFKPKALLYYITMFVFFCLGVTNFALYITSVETVHSFDGRWVRVTGRVEPVVEEDCFLLDVDRLLCDGSDIGYNGKLMVYPYGDVGEIKVGCEVTAEGRIRLPISRGYRNYCRGLGAEALLYSNPYHIEFGSVKPFSMKYCSWRAAGWVRKKLESDTVPFQHGEIMKGLLLGGREVGVETREKFSAVGISHLLAVSGLHIGIISAVLIWLLRKLGLSSRWRFILVCCVLAFFSFMVGLTPSVVRAVIMMGVVMLAAAVDRKPDMLTSLLVAAFLITVFKPYMIYSVSFQMSFMACLGIVLYYPVFERIFAFMGRYLSVAVSVTLSSQILILPLLIHYFGSFAPVSVIANILAVPLAGVVLWLTVAFLILYPLNIPLYYTVLFVNGIIIETIELIIDRIELIPFGSVRVENAGIVFYLVYYLAVAAVLVYVHKKDEVECLWT